jgi:hypothetical protein
LPLLHRQMLDVLGIKDAAKLVPMEEDQKPLDPVTENQKILTVSAVKAFIGQDHQAHIAVHMAMAQDPKIQAIVQMSPMKQQIESVLMAHVQEHLGMQYRIQVEQQLGMPLPPQHDEAGEDFHMDPDVEARLAPLLAQAATQLTMQNQAQAQQQQAQQQAQDPIIQMQQQELQIKAAEQQRKAAKDQTDAQLKLEQQSIERERIAAQAFADSQRTAVQAEQAKMKINSDMQKQTKDLFVKGLDSAHKHAGAKAQRNKGNPTKGE